MGRYLVWHSYIGATTGICTFFFPLNIPSFYIQASSESEFISNTLIMLKSNTNLANVQPQPLVWNVAGLCLNNSIKKSVLFGLI